MSVGELSGALPNRGLDSLSQYSTEVVVTGSVDGLHFGSVGHDDVLANEPIHCESVARPTGQLPEPDGVLPPSAIHELRTPLTSIHGYAQILQKSLADNPKASNALNVIVRESARLTQMLGELSDVVELHGTAAATCVSEVDVREAIEAAIETVSRQDGGQHQIVVDGSGRACADARRLTRALTHVITNAVVYSLADTAVTVTVAERDDVVEIAVTDEGIGIPPNDGERIYKPFQRGANARQLAGRGLGLGLCIAQVSLATDGGSLRHEAIPAGGTAFVISLPRP
jgi:two-component system sensor histidine kinase SenX3